MGGKGLKLVAELESRRCGHEAERGGGRRIRVAYLFTTFPALTETPSQRDLRALRALSVEPHIYSLWGGGREFEGQRIRRFNKWRLLMLLWHFPAWFIRKPRVFLGLARHLACSRMPYSLNALETLLGLAYAVCHASYFARPANRPDLIHAVWATMPGTAAQLLWKLTGIPFSLGAHSYDVFRNGGDWALTSKLQDASLIVTSSESTRRRLLERGANSTKLVLVGRGLDALPSRRVWRSCREPMRIVAVGRLVEKKGYFDQLAIYAALKATGLAFEARIVGAGPLERALKRRAAELGLSGLVTFMGPLPHDAVLEQYAWADVLLFTGKVARNGDRDGLPNVIPEAMAAGVPVVASGVGGVPEAVEDGRTGVLIKESGTEPWVSALQRLQSDNRYYEHLCARARLWVEAHYDARKNMRCLLDHFEAVVTSHAAVTDLPPRDSLLARSARGWASLRR